MKQQMDLLGFIIFYKFMVTEHIASKEKLQSLLNPDWWCANKPDGYGWEKRRETLLSMLDIDESSLMTDEIAEILMGQSVDDASKRIKVQLKNINANLMDIPVRIDEVNKQLNALPTDNVDELKEQLSELEEEILEEKKIIANIESVNEHQRHIQNIINNAYSELNTAKANYSIEYARLTEKANKPVQDAINQKRTSDSMCDTLEMKINIISRKIDALNSKINTTTESLNEMRKKYSDEESKVYIAGSHFCPTCNQPISQDQIQKAHEEFNLNKSKFLESCIGYGNKLKNELSSSENELNTLRNERNILKLQYDKEVESRDSIVIPTAKQIPTFEETEEGINLRIAYDKAREQLNNVSDTDELIKPYQMLIAQKTEEQNNIRTIIAQIASADSYKYRIKELKDEERKLSEQYAEIEHNLYIIEQYNKDRLNLLSGAIESKFKSLRFKMWKPNIGNDGIADCCDVLVSAPQGSIPYSSASTSQKIIANLELVSSLSKFWNIELFALVDNAEAIQKQNRPNYEIQTVWCEVQKEKE